VYGSVPPVTVKIISPSLPRQVTGKTSSEITGVPSSTKVKVAVIEQPFSSVPITVYVPGPTLLIVGPTTDKSGHSKVTFAPFVTEAVKLPLLWLHDGF
jgi:hypothetical protein